MFPEIWKVYEMLFKMIELGIFKVQPLLVFKVDAELHTSMKAAGHSHVQMIGIVVVPAETA